MQAYFCYMITVSFKYFDLLKSLIKNIFFPENMKLWTHESNYSSSSKLVPSGLPYKNRDCGTTSLSINTLPIYEYRNTVRAECMLHLKFKYYQYTLTCQQNHTIKNNLQHTSSADTPRKTRRTRNNSLVNY